MRGVAGHLVILGLSCAALVYLAFFGSPFGGDGSSLAGSISDAESVFVCRDGEVQQLMVPDLEERTLFENVDCASTFRWQLDNDFEQLVSTSQVGEGRHVFVTGLDGKAFDLSTYLGFESTFESPVDNWNPRFDDAGRVLFLDGEVLIASDPQTGASSELPLPASIRRDTWLQRNQCLGSDILPQVSAELVTLCPWGWYEQLDEGSSVSFYAPTTGSRSDDATLVAIVATPPLSEEVALRGDLGACASEIGDVLVYWVASRLICVGDGIGRVRVNLDGQAFEVTNVLEPSSRRPFNVIIDRDATWMYFTTDSVGAVGGRVLWRVAADGGEPEQLGIVTELTDAGEHAPFTLLGAS